MSSRSVLARPISAPARRRGLQAPVRYYVGRRPAQTEVYVVQRSELEPLAHLAYRSDAAFDWGGATEGALELAFAMLAHATQTRPTDLVCEAFCHRGGHPVGPRQGFVLGHGDIAALAPDRVRRCILRWRGA